MNSNVVHIRKLNHDFYVVYLFLFYSQCCLLESGHKGLRAILANETVSFK